jgi:hypothetical protein
LSVPGATLMDSGATLLVVALATAVADEALAVAVALVVVALAAVAAGEVLAAAVVLLKAAVVLLKAAVVLLKAAVVLLATTAGLLAATLELADAEGDWTDAAPHPAATRPAPAIAAKRPSRSRRLRGPSAIDPFPFLHGANAYCNRPAVQSQMLVSPLRLSSLAPTRAGIRAMLVARAVRTGLAMAGLAYAEARRFGGTIGSHVAFARSGGHGENFACLKA